MRALILILPLLAGCAGPGLEAGFDAPDPSARLHAVVQAARDGDMAAVPAIIDQLDSDDPAVRMLSVCALERLTGESRGYVATDPRPARLTAIRRWRADYPADFPAVRGRAGSPTPLREPTQVPVREAPDE